MLPDGEACVRLPGQDEGAPEAESAPNAHREPRGGWTVYDEIPRRPERDEDYGAYQLRKGYNQRLKKALSITAAAALLAIGGMELSQWYAKYQLLHRPIVKDVSLMNIADPAPAPVVPPPVIPKPVTPPRIEVTRVTPPRIVDEPRPDRAVKNNVDLDHTTIGKERLGNLTAVGTLAVDQAEPDGAFIDIL